MSQSKGYCIVLMPIGESGSEIRTRADVWFDKIISPALEELAYIPIRADRSSESGFISAQIFEHVMNDTMVVADLTYGNPNVYYEIAIRHACRKPIVHLLQVGHPMPFHVAPLRAARVDDSSETTVQGSKAEIVQFVLAAEENRRSNESPLSLGLGKWFLSAHPNAVPRIYIEELVLYYLHLSFAVTSRELPERCLRCYKLRKEVSGMEIALHQLTDRLHMPEPNAFRQLEKVRWDIYNKDLETPRHAGVEISDKKYDGAPVVKGTDMRLSELLTRLKLFLEIKGFYTSDLGLTQDQMEKLLEVGEDLLVASAVDRKSRNALIDKKTETRDT